MLVIDPPRPRQTPSKRRVSERRIIWRTQVKNEQTRSRAKEKRKPIAWSKPLLVESHKERKVAMYSRVNTR